MEACLEEMKGAEIESNPGNTANNGRDSAFPKPEDLLVLDDVNNVLEHACP